MTERIREFLHRRHDEGLDPGPCRIVDLHVIRRNDRAFVKAVTIREELKSDVAQREALLDAVFGATRFAKAAERLRENRMPAEKLSFTAAEAGRVVGTVRLWNIMAGSGRPALLLGPLAVASDRRNRGVGTSLMRHALREARRRGCRAIPLRLRGSYEQHRLLGLELVPGALDGACGLVSAACRPPTNIRSGGPRRGRRSQEPIFAPRAI